MGKIIICFLLGNLFFIIGFSAIAQNSQVKEIITCEECVIFTGLNVEPHLNRYNNKIYYEYMYLNQCSEPVAVFWDCDGEKRRTLPPGIPQRIDSYCGGGNGVSFIEFTCGIDTARKKEEEARIQEEMRLKDEEEILIAQQKKEEEVRIQEEMRLKDEEEKRLALKKKEDEEIAKWESQITQNRVERAETARQEEIASVERDRVAKERETRERAERERIARGKAEKESRERAERERNEQERIAMEERKRANKERSEQERAAAEGDTIEWIACGCDIAGGTGTQIILVFLEPFKVRSSVINNLGTSAFLAEFDRDGGVKRIRSGYNIEHHIMYSYGSKCPRFASQEEAQRWLNNQINSQKPVYKENIQVVKWTPPSNISGILN